VEAAYQAVGDIEVVKLRADNSLQGISLKKAYRVHAAHCYVEIPNSVELMKSTEQEGVRAHQRFLRFLHIFQRIVALVVQKTDVTKVDFQNQRLHFIVYRPFDDERKRIAIAVAVADLLQNLLLSANGLHQELEDAVISIGIDSGEALAVHNGTKGDRELLFLGEPANEAAKILGERSGIFLTNNARTSFNSKWEVEKPRQTSLTSKQIEECTQLAGFSLNQEKLCAAWKAELKDTPLKDFEFSRATPPLKDLNLENLTPKNSKRMEMAVIFADIDGFTRYVREHMDDENAPETIRLLHVVRKELRDVLNDFGGKKIRYIGDCMFGVLAEGTAKTTNLEETVSKAVQCAGAMRDAFGVIQEVVTEAKQMGLAIGVELGPTSLTRLGLKPGRDRCGAGCSVLEAETQQRACSGVETALGPSALKSAAESIKSLFKTGNKRKNVTYNLVTAFMEDAKDPVAKSTPLPPAAPQIIHGRAYTEG
jgi:class 3 adenylate cyclase